MAGGISLVGSLAVILRYACDSFGSPATQACAPGCSFNAWNAKAGSSKRKPAWRFLASGP